MAGNRAVWCLAIALTLAAARPAQAALTIADPGTFVVDKADVVDPATTIRLEAYLKELEQKTTAQVKLLTVPTTGGEDIFAFAQRHFELWKLGQKGKDNGALIVLSVNDRQARIHSGYGLEGALPDSWDGTLLRKVRDRYFRDRRYSQGLDELVVAVANKVADEYQVQLQGVPPIRHEAEESPPGFFFCFAFLLFFIVPWLIILSRRRRYRRTWRGGVGDAVLWGSILSDVLTSAGRSTWSGRSGGGFGGGLGGGGSFGGGGRTGGGGASTSW